MYRGDGAGQAAFAAFARHSTADSDSFCQPQPSSRRWNLFARVLQDVLAAHGCRLGQVSARTSIHPAKLARLQASLDQLHPKRFPLLPRQDIDEIIRAFHLSSEEQLQLRAAVLATAAERVLMNSLDPENALLAAEQFFAATVDELRRHGGEVSGLGAYARGSGSDGDESDEGDA